MAIFGPKPWVNPFGKMSNFRLFQVLVFIAQKRVFFVVEYRKRHFSGLYCLKQKKFQKWPFLDQNHGLTPLKKCQFFDFGNSCFYSLDRRFFDLEHPKRHFASVYWLKKKVGKMAIFGPKPWFNPFRKMSIFSTL